MTVDEIIAEEQMSMGRPVTLIDSAHLKGGITVVTYSITYDDDETLGTGTLHTVRAAMYKDGSRDGAVSIVVSTEWS